MAERGGPRVVVLGSVHMDLIGQASTMPAPGQSVVGDAFVMAPGGKGGNQAAGLALAGAKVWMVTRLGDDDFGHQLTGALKAKGVQTELVTIDENVGTGASTVLAAGGEYASVIVPGAAGLLSKNDIEAAAGHICAADALVLQLELGAEISALAAGLAAKSGARVILNGSPAVCEWSGLPQTLCRATDTLVVNAGEAGRLAGKQIDPGRLESEMGELATLFGVSTLVITLGAGGAVAFEGGNTCFQPGFEVAVSDSVGAGDSFLAAFVVARLEGAGLAVALKRGAAAGALAVGCHGAYDGLPRRGDIDRFLETRETAKGPGK
jgi:ribokinase